MGTWTLAALPLTGSVVWAVEEATNKSPGFDFIAPILSTGLVGVFLLMILFRVKIMPTYVYEDAKKEWERERAEKDKALADAAKSLTDGQKVYTEQVIPTLTRALDAERELLDLRREEQRDRRRPNDDR